MSSITLYTQETCSKSGTAQSFLENANAPFEVVDLTKSTPSVQKIMELAHKIGAPVRELVRTKESLFQELSLNEEGMDDKAWAEVLAKHPILIERPIAEMGDRALVARPPERVQEFL